jgi:hypothetical protein
MQVLKRIKKYRQGSRIKEEEEEETIATDAELSVTSQLLLLGLPAITCNPNR